MKVEIDVPQDTKAISVNAIYGNESGYSVGARVFLINNGTADDGTGKNSVIQQEVTQ
ncbi:hypothetical protein DSECCO2_396960 [anaerobic digester metagenome]